MRLQAIPSAPAIDVVAAPSIWRIDASRSEVRFAVRHLMVATVHGRFTCVDGRLDVGPDGVAKATGAIRTAALDTGEPIRDARLRSPDFFDADRYPAITFGSTSIDHVEGPRFRIVGALTIRRVTREIILESIVYARTEQRMMLALHGQLSQRAFGVGRQALQANRVLLGDRIDVMADIALQRALGERTNAG
jgi:polyisoprenoid-binding protein YceI